MPVYTIKDRSQEFECPQCGEPLYSGERAYQDGTDGDCYCSAACCIRAGVIEHARSQKRAENAREESDITGA